MTYQLIFLILFLSVISLFPLIQLGIFLILMLISLILFAIYSQWKSCQNPAQQVIFLARGQSIVLSTECIVLILIILFKLLTNSEILLQFTNMTSSSNLIQFITAKPTDGVSVLIGIITITVAYLYLFSVLSQTKFFAKGTVEQEKYYAIFWGLPVILLIGGVIIYFVVMISPTIPEVKNPIFNNALFWVGILNISITIPFVYYLKQNFYNVNLDDSNGLKKGDYNYKFLENFQQLESPVFETWSSDCVLIMTILWPLLALFFNCNLILLLMTEYCLLVAHIWASQLRLLPREKTTLELTSMDCNGKPTIISDVYLLSDSSDDYIIYLNENNQITKLMKSSLNKIVEQKVVEQKE